MSASDAGGGPPTYDVRFDRAAEKAFRQLPRPVQRRIATRIEALRTDPRPPGAKRLQGASVPLYRVRIGDYRVVYEIQDDVLVVLVLRVGHRRDVYGQGF